MVVCFSGPLLDRIGLHIEVPQMKFREMSNGQPTESSAEIRQRVITARELKAHCALDAATQDLLKHAMTEYNLSARAYDRILKVARTIADLRASETISSDDVSEAIQFRALDRQLWG